MARNSAIPPESFEEILAWLDPDREVAGAIYVQLCHDLAQIFTWNRCSDPEGLTDEVFDRVSRKVHEVRKTYVGDPRLYFYGVARNLIKEIRNRAKEQVPLEDTEVVGANPTIETGEEIAEMRENCLNSCLELLGQEKRELILNYYARDKQAKIEHRTKLAQQLGISVQTLRVRVHRIRLALEQCIERCLARMDQGK
ncbi:MAG TPA: sigma-70 family RNA polymerase sigma factor [Pyrinomonadaceae bacterium]